MNVAVDGKYLVCGVVNSCIAYKWATHIVVLNIPETAHFDPLLAINYNGAIERTDWNNTQTLSVRNLLNSNHIRAIAWARNAACKVVTHSYKVLYRERALALVWVAIAEEALT